MACLSKIRKMTLSSVGKWEVSMEGKKSKRGIIAEGRPTKRTPEVVAKIPEERALERPGAGISYRSDHSSRRASLIALWREACPAFEFLETPA
jgi:hypothetical protein